MPADFTRHVALILDNDEGLYLHRLELVDQARGCEYPNAVLQDSLKDLVETLVYGYDEDRIDEMSMMARELLGCAISSVDWYALAAGYLDEDD